MNIPGDLRGVQQDQPLHANGGDKVNYTIHHKGGYVFDHPIPGIVVRRTAKRVRIAVWDEQSHKIKEKSVHPAYLSLRNAPAHIDEAMEEAKRYTAEP